MSRRRTFPWVNGNPEPLADHCFVEVTWTDGELPQRFCGDNWCTGQCRFPALILPKRASPFAPESKASGSQVACGPVFQPLRVKWRGKRVIVPAQYRQYLSERWYP